MEVHEILTRALTYLEEVGWTPSAGDYDGRYRGRTCMMGGVYIVTDGVFEALHPAILALQSACGDHSLIRFNDSQPSFAPIKAAFCRAIEATTPTDSQSPSVTSQPQREPEPVLLGTS